MILERRYRIELEAIEPLRIGAVDDPRSGIHKPVAKVGDRVVIPGPSLKGALRAEVEQFLIDAYYDNKSQTWKRDKAAFQPCIPATKLTTDEQELIALGKYAEACHYPCQFDKRTEGGYTKFTGECTTNGEPNLHSICPACYFLGAMRLSGFVRVPFLYAEISPEELYSARINRMSSTVVEGTNRPYQLTPVGTKFSGNLVIIFQDPITGWRIGEPRPLKDKTLGDKWLEDWRPQAEELVDTYIVKRLENIRIIGGYKSKGFGAVKIRVTPLS